MLQASMNFLKAIWGHLSIASFGVGAVAGYYGGAAYDFVRALLPVAS